ncbi:ATP-binding cassette domain-containing protein [Rapidithrix thailandica]|uniref:ATP-binding cassette domain-containing protein n=1 Tax=Rapidithrix thailandica TaxID=413964 RepID=A0AAW9SA44_9BACT
MIQCIDLRIEQGDFRLSGVDFRIETGEYACLMGKTGSGKTTILEAVCGLRNLQGGKILVDERDITQLKPAERGIGFVPQDAALFTTMTVRENMGFALKIRKWSKKAIDTRAEELAELLDISHLLNRKPKGLSGGEKQRVAIGRALSFYPSVICLDEPLSALDDSTKQELYQLIYRLRKDIQITALHITHALDEVRNLADKVLYLHQGKLQAHPLSDFLQIEKHFMAKEER